MEKCGVGSEMVDLIRQTIIGFCREFIERPYLCYTEHGLHALFFTRLYQALPAESRYARWNSHDLCVLQKEYPTASDLSKSQRQHWDISIIKTPIVACTRREAFDYLPLTAVVEFGLNCQFDHLEDDVARLCHPGANVDNRFVVHLYRLSAVNDRISGRDWAPKSSLVCSTETIQIAVMNRPVEVFYGMVDVTCPNRTGLWIISSIGTIKAG